MRKKERKKGEEKGSKGKLEKKENEKKDPLPDLEYFCIVFCTPFDIIATKTWMVGKSLAAYC